jgi:hypothetical protein
MNLPFWFLITLIALNAIITVVLIVTLQGFDRRYRIWEKFDPEMFERFRQRTPWAYIDPDWSLHLQELRAEIARLARQNEIFLTPGTIVMLIIPIEEAYLRTGEINIEETKESLGILIRAMRETGDPRDRENQRSSFSLIRAFWKKFCNIPPFCSRTERG